MARAVGATVQTAGTHSTALAYSYIDGLGNDGYHWIYAPGAGGGIIPTNDGKSCLFLSLAPDILRSALGDRSPRAFRRAIGRHLPVMGDIVPAAGLDGRVFVHGGATGFIRQAAGPGWALVGDSGYFKDPITAHGITDAFRDAELLARAALGGDAMSFPAARDPLIGGFFRLTEEIASFDWTLDRLKTAHVELNVEMKRSQAWMDVSKGDRHRAA